MTCVAKVSYVGTNHLARMLPRPGAVVVRQGEIVNALQVVGMVADARSFRVIRADEQLKVSEEEVKEYLLVQEGERLQKGTPILKKSRRVAGSTVISSPAPGIVYEIRKGKIILQLLREPLEVRALVAGRVSRVIPFRGAILEVNGGLIEAVWDSGKEGTGRLTLLAEAPDAVLNTDHFSSDMYGKIIVAGHLGNRYVLEKLEELGIRGVIAGSMKADLFGIAAKYTYPIFITDGAGKLPLSKPIFDLLSQSDGKDAALIPHISGIIGQPPSILISLPLRTLEADVKPIPGALEVGSAVRVVGVHDGLAIGRIASLCGKPRRSEAGALTYGAEVRLTDGQIHFIPVSNMELIS